MPLVILTCGTLKCYGWKETQNKKSNTHTTMKHKQATRLDEMEKRQQDSREEVDQMMEMVMDQIKGKGISEDPNSKERLAYEKNDNQWKKHLPNLDHLFEKGKSIKGSTKQAREGYDFMIKRLETVEDMSGLGSMDANELILVHDLIIPPRFKIPEFEKYDGTECPKAHLVAYCHKMVGYTNDEKLLIHVF